MFFYMEECLFLNEIVQRDKTSKMCVSIVYTETETYVTTFAPFLFFFPTFTSLLFNFYSCVCVCLLKIIITIKQKPIPNQTNIYRPRYSSPASEQNNPTAYQTVTVEDTPLHGVTNKERQRLCVYIAHAIFPKIRNTQVLSKVSQKKKKKKSKRRRILRNRETVVENRQGFDRDDDSNNNTRRVEYSTHTHTVQLGTGDPIGHTQKKKKRRAHTEKETS